MVETIRTVTGFMRSIGSCIWPVALLPHVCWIRRVKNNIGKLDQIKNDQINNDKIYNDTKNRTINRVRQKTSFYPIQVTWKKSNGDVLDPETLPDNFKLSEDRLTLTIDVSHI